jgi:hypothetical protein
MDEIGLVEAIAAVRSELSEAVAIAETEDIRFPVDNVTLEFQVGVTRDAHAEGKLKVWVLELGARGGYEAESVQKVVLTLGPPVNPEGETIAVKRRTRYEP